MSPRKGGKGARSIKAPPRVVLDTNVVLSALVFRSGATARSRTAWQSGVFRPLASTATVAELIRALAYAKFKLSAAEQHELLADYLPMTEVVEIPDPPPRVPRCRDESDLPFVHLAVAAHADALVTGNADLRALAGRSNIPILAPDEFTIGFAVDAKVSRENELQPRQAPDRRYPA